MREMAQRFIPLRAASVPDFTPFCNPNFTYARYLLAQNIIRLKKHTIIFQINCIKPVFLEKYRLHAKNQPFSLHDSWSHVKKIENSLHDIRPHVKKIGISLHDKRSHVKKMGNFFT